MKHKILKRLTFNLLLPYLGFISLGMAGEGGSVAGGADYHPNMKAWFTSDDLNRNVNTCIEVGEKFSFSKGFLKSLTLKTFETWSNYYKSVGAFNRSEEKSNWNACKYSEKDIRHGFRIATKINLKDTCSGTEDLTIYFGVESEELKKRKSKFNFAFAFAELRNELPLVSIQPAWSKGLIYIASDKSINEQNSIPSWSNYMGSALEMVLLHEMGHVFGVDHIKGTIMNETIGASLMNLTAVIPPSIKTNSTLSPILTSIDQSNFLIFRKEKSWNINYVSPKTNCGESDDECFEQENNKKRFRSSFKKLTGLDLKSNHFLTFLKKEGVNSSQLSDGSVIRRVPISTFDFSMQLIDFNESFDLKFKALSSVKKTDGFAFRDGCNRELGHSFYSVYGVLKNQNGDESPVILNINSDTGRIEIIDPNPIEDDDCRIDMELGLSCTILSTSEALLKNKLLE